MQIFLAITALLIYGTVYTAMTFKLRSYLLPEARGQGFDFTAGRWQFDKAVDLDESRYTIDGKAYLKRFRRNTVVLNVVSAVCFILLMMT